jgi:hypothetical protein
MNCVPLSPTIQQLTRRLEPYRSIPSFHPTSRDHGPHDEDLSIRRHDKLRRVTEGKTKWARRNCRNDSVDGGQQRKHQSYWSLFIANFPLTSQLYTILDGEAQGIRNDKLRAEAEIVGIRVSNYKKEIF